MPPVKNIQQQKEHQKQTYETFLQRPIDGQSAAI